MARPDSGFDLIPPSARASLSFLEHARVEVHGGTVVYRASESGRYWDYNIPYVNTSIVYLGEGTSITRDAARMLADHGVLVAFVGGGGSPLSSAMDPMVLPLLPQDEYRPTQYMQAWACIYADEGRRLQAAKRLIRMRVDLTESLWAKLPQARDYGLSLRNGRLGTAQHQFVRRGEEATSVAELLSAEGNFAKAVYAHIASLHGQQDFVRSPGAGKDVANRLLDHLNYLLYGAAAVALHGLGISFAMPLLHGKTRRGALVFDIADLVKDGLSLPIAFWGASEGKSDQECRTALTDAMHELAVLPTLFDWLKDACAEC